MICFKLLTVAQFSTREDELATTHLGAVVTGNDKYLRPSPSSLSRERKGRDIAAVTYKFFPDLSTESIRMQFFFSKNHTYSSAERTYLNSIFRHLEDV